MQYVPFFRYTNTRVPKIIVYQNVLVHILLFLVQHIFVPKKMIHIMVHILNFWYTMICWSFTISTIWYTRGKWITELMGISLQMKPALVFNIIFIILCLIEICRTVSPFRWQRHSNAYLFGESRNDSILSPPQDLVLGGIKSITGSDWLTLWSPLQ